MAIVSREVDIVAPLIQRLCIEPGEVLVVKGMRFCLSTEREEFRKQIEEAMPGIKLLLLPEHCSLSVIKIESSENEAAITYTMELDYGNRVTESDAAQLTDDDGQTAGDRMMQFFKGE